MLLNTCAPLGLRFPLPNLKPLSKTGGMAGRVNYRGDKILSQSPEKGLLKPEKNRLPGSEVSCEEVSIVKRGGRSERLKKKTFLGTQITEKGSLVFTAKWRLIIPYGGKFGGQIKTKKKASKLSFGYHGNEKTVGKQPGGGKVCFSPAKIKLRPGKPLAGRGSGEGPSSLVLSVVKREESLKGMGLVPDQ